MYSILYPLALWSIIVLSLTSDTSKKKCVFFLVLSYLSSLHPPSPRSGLPLYSTTPHQPSTLGLWEPQSVLARPSSQVCLTYPHARSIPYLLTFSGGLYLEPLRKDPSSGGIALKITRGPDGLYNGEPQQVFSYNLADKQVWYDLSSVFGPPFKGSRVEVTSNTGGDIIWAAGTNPGGSQLRHAPDEENVWFTIYGTR